MTPRATKTKSHHHQQQDEQYRTNVELEGRVKYVHIVTIVKLLLSNA
jgi:hypothetical protein